MADGDRRDAGELDVFVSYDHEAEREFAAAEMLAEALKAAGYSVWWDRELMIGKRWSSQIEAKARLARRMVALMTMRSTTRFWCKLEWVIGANAEKLAPVRLEPCEPPEEIAGLLTPLQYLDLAPDAPDFCRRIIDALDIPPSAPPLPPQPPSLVPIRLLGFPAAPPRLIGRETEMEMLRRAWAGDADVVVLHALGGAGKSAVLTTFLREILDQRGDGASRIFGWSAYSQGTGADKATSADAFITEALRFFGHAGPMPSDAVERARALADLVAGQRALLLLDGIEPLQEPAHVRDGRLKDRGLAALIQRLARGNTGLLVVTSRQPLWELRGAGARVWNHPLDRLSDPAGADLLTHLGVIGRRRELEAATRDLDGHALSVTLLGTYLNAVAGGDIDKREKFDFAALMGSPEDQAADDETARLARRAGLVIEGYLERLDDVERALLHLLGLFDRPADGPAVRALLAGPAIPGLTDALFAALGLDEAGVSEAALQDGAAARRLSRAKRRLRALRLLAAEDPSDRDGLDAHPVLRSWFRQRLRSEAPEAWRQANGRLHRLYAAAAPERPDTLEQMTPLFHAIGHGVAAGRAREAFDDIYYARVRRRDAAYLTKQLGAFGANLAALAPFFERLWDRPSPALTPAGQAAALNYAAFALRGLGRLADAVGPFGAGEEMSVAQKDWKGAAQDAGNLGELLLTLGRVAEAGAAAGRAVAHADASGDAFWRMGMRTLLADAAHQAGDLARAGALFGEAERMQAEWQPSLPRLYSLQGYQYCDLLLGRGEAGEVLGRATEMIADEASFSLLTKALYRLALGRAHALLAEASVVPGRAAGVNPEGRGAEGGAPILDLPGSAPRAAPERRAEPTDHAVEAARRLDQAVAGLREAGVEVFIPSGLLARAAFRRWRFAIGADPVALPLARDDLDETEEIAAHGGMRLFLADLALERARLALALGDRAEAKTQAETAGRLIAETGYHRRDGELEAIRAGLAALA